MALKKFIISSNCPTGPKEILQNGKFGMLFKVKNFKQLEKKIIEFYNKKKSYQRKIRAAYTSLERFEMTKNCNKYLELINKLWKLLLITQYSWFKNMVESLDFLGTFKGTEQ